MHRSLWLTIYRCCFRASRSHFERCYLCSIHILIVTSQDVVQLRRSFLVMNNLLALFWSVFYQFKFLHLFAYFRLNHFDVVAANARLDQLLVHSLFSKLAVLFNQVIVAYSEVYLSR